MGKYLFILRFNDLNIIKCIDYFITNQNKLVCILCFVFKFIFFTKVLVILLDTI